MRVQQQLRRRRRYEIAPLSAQGSAFKKLQEKLDAEIKVGAAAAAAVTVCCFINCLALKTGARSICV